MSWRTVGRRYEASPKRPDGHADHGFVSCDLTGSRVVHKGCVNHLKSVRVLYSVSEVILALGDSEEVSRSVGASLEAVKHWRKKNRIPLAYAPRIRHLLASRRYATIPILFRAVG